MRFKYLLIIWALGLNYNLVSQDNKFVVLANPIKIDKEEGLNFVGEECLILLPENRDSPNSRKIAVHFFRFKAKNASDLPPAFYLPGGPGGYYSDRHFYEYYGGDKATSWVFQLNEINATRDLIILNQRGNSYAPGFSISDFKYSVKVGEKHRPIESTELAEKEADAIASYAQSFTDQGIDINGYDFISLVDDIEDIRKHYGYDKVALVGTSFGSQWALGYIQKYPHRSDRALLSGIEPLDHAWDDPAEVWKVYQSLAEIASKDQSLQAHLPEIGLIEATKTIINRLSEKPVKVHLQIPNEGIDQMIEIGPNEFRMNLDCPFSESREEELELWPKYITEMYNGDYRVLAYWTSEVRGHGDTESLINPLIDNSLGISDKRDQAISHRAEIQWMGDANSLQRILKSKHLIRDIGDNFRSHIEHDIPILMLHGHMDRSTPISNAYFLKKYLNNGHLITLKNGTHSAKRALILENPKFAKHLFEFMSIDLTRNNISDFFKGLPTLYELPSINFSPIDGKTIFDMILETDQ